MPRSSLREAHTRGASCCSKASSSERELPEIAQRRLAVVVHDEAQVADARARACSPRPLEVFVKVNTGMNRLGLRARRGRGVVRAARRTRPSVAALRLMMHFARADEDDGIERAARGVRGGVPRPAVSALARATRPASSVTREVGGDIVRPGIMLYGATPFPYDTAEMLGPAAGDDAALGDHRGAVARAERQRGLRRRRTPRRARTASASSPAATPTAIRATRRTARRCWCADARCGSRAACRWT